MTTDTTPGEPAGATTVPARRRALTFLEIAPVALVVVAEAAWVSVIGGFIQEVRLQAPVLGIPALTLFVVAGLVAARTIGPRIGDRWAFVGLALSLAAGAIGWLASSDARASLLAGDLPKAISENPGGWVAGLALLRGFATARFPLSADTCARMLQLGIPGLALIAVIGGAVVEPWRSIFLADTLIASVVFVACGTFALAFARQRTIAGDSHLDWRRNRSWLGMLVGAVVVASLIALVSAGSIGTAIPILIGISIGPLVILGLVFGTNRRTIRVVGICAAVAVLIYVVLTSVVTIAPPPPTDGSSGNGLPPSPETDPSVIVGLGGISVVLALIAVLILIRLWMSQMGPVEGEPDEIRTIDRGEAPDGPGSARRRRRHGTPVDATTAYLALMDDLERRPGVDRDPSETPAEHARRLRLDGTGDLGLDLLAADYALVSFGGIGLPAREDRRAVARWRRLRASLGRT